MKRGLKISQVVTDRSDASLTAYFRDVRKLSRISSEEELRLAERVQQGDHKAEEELIQANLRFVISIAKQYQNCGLDLVDLIQEGNLGIVRAAKKFKPELGFRFVSYAVWWIRQAIIKAISDNCRTVRMPMSQIINLGKITKAIKEFEQENERTPTADEVGDLTEMDPVKVSAIQTANIKPMSLESPVKQDEDACCLLDIVPNSSNVPTDDNLEKNDLSNRIEYVIKRLPIRDGDILRMVYGIGVSAMSKEKIAEKFGISAERVRQITHGAIKRIRENYLDKLKELQ